MADFDNRKKLPNLVISKWTPKAKLKFPNNTLYSKMENCQLNSEIWKKFGSYYKAGKIGKTPKKNKTKKCE